MRQYRGRIKDSTVWVYGYYTKSPQGIARIWSPITKDNGESYLYDYVVDPETVGQLTGLRDRNGKEIYEGDIVKVGMNGAITEVTFEDGSFLTIVGESRYRLGGWETDAVEVLGNKWDYPHLLKGDGNDA